MKRNESHFIYFCLIEHIRRVQAISLSISKTVVLYAPRIALVFHFITVQYNSTGLNLKAVNQQI